MRKLTEAQFESVRRWMYRNARPVDIARWRYFFEGGSINDVICALSAYQNADGGFGHAIEPDSWNPDSSPIHTWYAAQIFDEVRLAYAKSPLITGIIRYFSDAQMFGENEWNATVPSMNDYPHAPWWGHDESSQPGDEINYNPTASIAGFLIRYSGETSAIYKKAADIAVKIYNQYMKSDFIGDMHSTWCLIEMCERVSKSGKAVFDCKKLREKLINQVEFCIDKNTDEWKTGYICTPSHFIVSPDSVYASKIMNFTELEGDIMIDMLNEDGTWNIPWGWGDYNDEWAISKKWWKANRAIINIRYLKNFGRI